MDIKNYQLNSVYREIAELCGIEIAIVFFENFKGLQVTFPVRFYDRDYILKQIRKEFNGSNTKELALKYAY